MPAVWSTLLKTVPGAENSLEPVAKVIKAIEFSSPEPEKKDEPESQNQVFKVEKMDWAALQQEAPDLHIWKVPRSTP